MTHSRNRDALAARPRRERVQMAISASPTTQPEVTDSYARLEEKVLERDQRGASQIFYDLVRAGRPLPELVREIVRIHAPYTHVPYHQRLDDGVVRFVNNDHCFLSSRASTDLMKLLRPELAYLPLAQTIWYVPTGLDPWNQLLAHLVFAGLIDVQDRVLHNRSYTTGHKSYRARATVQLARMVGWEHAGSVLYAGVPDMAVGPRWHSTYEMACLVVQNILGGKD